MKFKIFGVSFWWIATSGSVLFMFLFSFIGSFFLPEVVVYWISLSFGLIFISAILYSFIYNAIKRK